MKNERENLKKQHERAAISSFATWYSKKNGCLCAIAAQPDPPDAILQLENSCTWIEHTDAYSNEQAAKFIWLIAQSERDPKLSRDSLFSGDIVTAVVTRIKYKLCNPSYGEVYEKYHRGILLITVQDPLFDSAKLAQLQAILLPLWQGQLQWGSLGFFNQVYLRYPCNFDDYKIVAICCGGYDS